MSSQICDCIGQLPFAQGVLCNCTLHLANLGDCRAVGAFRTVLSPQTTWIGPPKQLPTKTKKQKVRIQYASSWTGQQQPMAAMAQRPALSNLKSVMSHDQPFDIGSVSSITSVDMQILYIYMYIQPKSSTCFHHGGSSGGIAEDTSEDASEALARSKDG